MASKFFSKQFDTIGNEKLRRRKQFLKRMEAKMRFKRRMISLS